ncbi:Uncharacterized protein dnm_074410 [Desulfonema magnum]|uniref:Uncharacterized protein n=1 Tax=Desulfonema magnum TaxID=45655 RepID=A0A975GRS3_9BACT|nr:Uncharacterized protein dnm_074410 [Desulfonema magnum]
MSRFLHIKPVLVQKAGHTRKKAAGFPPAAFFTAKDYSELKISDIQNTNEIPNFHPISPPLK